MAHCNLCNKNTRCSCKWGGCPWCNSTNKQVSFINDLLKFWVSKDLVKEKLKEFRSYVDKVDSYTAYEYIEGKIDKETFDAALEQYKSKPRKRITKSKSEVEGFVPTSNPKNQCVFNSNSPWARCIHCNSIRKYMQWKPCPKYIWDEE